MTVEEKRKKVEEYCDSVSGPCDSCCPLYNATRHENCFSKGANIERNYAILFGADKPKNLVDMSKAHSQIMDSFITAFETVLDQIEEQCAVEVDEPKRTAYEGNEVVSNVDVYGLEKSIIRSKYPKAVDISKCTAEVTDGVRNLAACQTGTGHDNFLNGIIVQFDLTLTVKAWVEAERYHFLDFVSSQSTMHKIAQFNIAKQCHEYVDKGIIDIVERYVQIYNEDPTPENYLKLLYNIPVGFKLTAGMTTNYRQLKTIYQQRKAHRLPEWRQFCKWIETLPMSEFITGKSGDENA